MHNRKLITLLAGTAAIAAAPLAWTQATYPTVGTGTSTSGSTTTEDRTMGTTGNSSTMSDQVTSDTTTGSTSSASGTANLQGTDATFLQKAMAGGREEIQNAQVAMRSAQRVEVRNAASMMLEDHTRTNQKLEQLASSKGWDVPAASDTAESDQSRLDTGAAFDDNYLEQEIRHHRETISLYRAQASTGSDPELRQFAKDTLPGLEHHLEMLQGSISAK